MYVSRKDYYFFLVLQGETPLHTAAQQGLANLTRVLLEKGANPNAQTTGPIDDTSTIYRQTALHLAINNRHQGVVRVFLDFKGELCSISISIKI